jgi:hypothetical protein
MASKASGASGFLLGDDAAEPPPRAPPARTLLHPLPRSPNTPEALLALLADKLCGEVKVCAVEAPGSGDNRKANLQDIAILTGGQVASENVGIKLDEVTTGVLGTCKEIEVSKDATTTLDGAGDREALDERADLLHSTTGTTKSDCERGAPQERLAKLSGGVTVTKVGGRTASSSSCCARARGGRRRAAAGAHNARPPSAPPAPPPTAGAATENERVRLPRESKL